MSSNQSITVNAPAKTNLWLKVLGRRDDGFHALETRMVHLSLADKLTLSWRDTEGIAFTCSDPGLSTGEDNLVVRAVRAMEQHLGQRFGISIHLEKITPYGAGLGGGSSDAAAVLRAINEMGNFHLPIDTLVQLAASIGSDVPFFIYDCPCDVSGRGEIVTPLGIEHSQRLPILLLKPAFGVSAAWAYQNYAKSKEYQLDPIVPQTCPWGTMENDLEYPVFTKYIVLREMKEWLLARPEVHAALLSGSGSTVLAVQKDNEGGQAIARDAVAHFGENTWTYCGHIC